MKKLLNCLIDIFLFIFIYNTKDYTIKSKIYLDLNYSEYKVYCIYRILIFRLRIYQAKFNYLSYAYDYIHEHNGIIFNVKHEYK